MTREEIRQRIVDHERDYKTCIKFINECAETISILLDELDAKDGEIAELEKKLEVATKTLQKCADCFEKWDGNKAGLGDTLASMHIAKEALKEMGEK